MPLVAENFLLAEQAASVVILRITGWLVSTTLVVDVIYLNVFIEYLFFSGKKKNTHELK